jgi:hypothetical protein
MSDESHHLTPHPDGGWQVKKSGDPEASRRFDTKAEGEDYGREVSRNQNTEFVIHRSDGTIQDSDSHGNDPHPPDG